MMIMKFQYQHQPRKIYDWILRERIPPGDGLHPAIVMLHGWTGDENAMWIFAPRLPTNVNLIAPRAIYKSPLGGYSWTSQFDSQLSSLDELSSAVVALHELIQQDNFPHVDLSIVHFLGFSQGAALAFTFALTYPERTGYVAGLSGFLPENISSLVEGNPLNGKHVFLAHGTQDHLIPIERAQQAARALGKAGARVSFCVDNVGHKLSAACFLSLSNYFRVFSD
jgi:phospholipase/carboxylesterase